MKRPSLLVLGLLVIGCSSPPEGHYLELVPNREAHDQPAEPLSDTLLLTWRPAPGEGPLEVTLPLPADSAELTVRSLAAEVDAGSFEVGGEDPRVLRLRAAQGAPAIRIRLQLERRQRLTTTPLPASLDSLSRTLDPAEWVSQAAAAAPEVAARVVFGLAFDGPQVTLCAWPEVELEDGWLAVPLEPALGEDRLRLGPLEPTATRDGAPAELTVEAQRLP